MADPTSALATPVATVDTPGTAMIPLSDPGSSMDVTTTPPGTVQPVDVPGTATLVQPTQWTAPQPGQVDTVNAPQSSQAIQAAATHQNWLSHIIDTVGTILGGDQTLTITKSPDGSIKVDHNPSTSGEKWGRIAAAALGGAAKGLAAGQGPGGAARAVAAGTEYGLQQPQQRLDQANQQAATMSAQQLRNAQNIALNQQVFANGFNNSHLPEEYAKKQAADAIAQAKEMDGLHAIHVASGIKNGAEIAQYGKTNPNAVQAHVGTNGDMLYNLPDGRGGVDVWQIPANIGNQLTTDDDHWVQTVLDPHDGTKTIEKPQVTLAGQETVAGRASRRMANNVAADTAIKSATAAAAAATTAGAAVTRANAAQTAATQNAPHIQAQTREANATADLKTRQANLLAGGAGAGGAGGAAGLTGDAYLQAAVDPSMWNQIKTTAKGDLKMPTASRSPANQAFRNAVLNYDPTFTDARYTGKQQFKTGTESTKLNQLSTGLEHLESAISHADYNPLMPYSDKATAYAEDIKHFTQESGKYIKSGALTQGEYDDLMTKANSVIPSVRMAALREKASLLGGKVRASFQQYRAATGQDLPVEEFFAPDTRARLTRYALTPADQGTPTPTPTPTNAPANQGAPPINLIPPGHDTTFANGQVWRNDNGTATRVK